jgi:MarR family transcriptional regulator for hemolysin
MANRATSQDKRVFQRPPDQLQILGLAINTLGRHIVWCLADRTAQHGVMPGAYPVIAWLMQLTDATQSELARIIGVEQPTMAATLKRMERDGLITRKPDPNHGRRSRVKLTQKGKQLSEVMFAAAREVEKIATRGISKAELQQFFATVDTMTNNLSEERHATMPNGKGRW